MKLRFCLLFVVAVLLMLSGCSSMKATRESLDENLRSYNQSLRWQEGPSAVSLVAEVMKPQYLDMATGFNRVRIVDYRVKAVDLKPEQKRATVLVEYDYHLKSGLTIKTVLDTQKWEYVDSVKPEGWRLTSYPPAFP